MELAIIVWLYLVGLAITYSLMKEITRGPAQAGDRRAFTFSLARQAASRVRRSRPLSPIASLTR